jgi:hypothetical protein
MERQPLRLIDRTVDLRLPADAIGRRVWARYRLWRARGRPEWRVRIRWRAFGAPYFAPRVSGERWMYYAFDARADRRRGVVEAEVHPHPAHVDTLLRVLAATWGPASGYVLVHAAAVRLRDGRGILFPGADGAGKTTLMRKVRADAVLGDDVVALDVRRAGAPRVLATPFRGMFAPPGPPRAAPLAAICALGRGGPSLDPLAPADALAVLVGQAIMWDTAQAGRILRLLSRAARVPAFALRVRLRTPWRLVRRMILRAGV